MKINVVTKILLMFFTVLLSSCNSCSSNKATTTSESTKTADAPAPAWLQGVYINQDEGALIDEVVFDKDGKAAVDMIRRVYSMNSKDGVDYVVLQSNGTFTFIVPSDKSQLLPADNFTKEWFTTSSLKLDPDRKDTCEW